MAFVRTSPWSVRCFRGILIVPTHQMFGLAMCALAQTIFALAQPVVRIFGQLGKVLYLSMVFMLPSEVNSTE